MEGRARARPNMTLSGGTPADTAPSMEGRARARPNRRSVSPTQPVLRAFNGGPGTCPAKPVFLTRVVAPSRCLQWRAGHVPGQTTASRYLRSASSAPSMEGRARARPNSAGIDRGSGDQGPSMEGRARARPNHPRKALRLAVVGPSMEGRARARPNVSVDDKWAALGTTLQWRAGHVPGQTNDPVPCWVRPVVLQWRAGHVPGQTTTAVESRRRLPSLQWRAGHVPGQTRRSEGGARPGDRPFNGGPGTCPAKPEAHARRYLAVRVPSMEGRARARPNRRPRPLHGGHRLPSMEGRARARPNW